MKIENEQLQNTTLKTTEDKSTSEDQPPDCWRVIGVGGDRSCPELETYIHCRNCPVMADAAEAFFNRAPPEGYLDDGNKFLEQPPKAPNKWPECSNFRLADEWFSLDAAYLTEVTPLRKIHTIPHRTNSIRWNGKRPWAATFCPYGPWGSDKWTQRY